MKQLFLASSGTFVTNDLRKYLKKPINEYKLAYITTAKKGTDDVSYVQDRIQTFKKQNIDYQEIDIEQHEKPELKKLLKSKDIIYIEGGNTFYLMNAIKKTGFKNTLNYMINKGKIYVGSSAGSYICCPSIEMATRKTNKVRNKYGLKSLTGLNIVDFLIFVHYKPEYNDVLKDKIKNSKYKVRILKDGQAIMINGNNIKLIGGGQEINL